MYKLILSLTYLRGRLITMFSILFVFLGVMALIVINSVMGGFQKEFKARLRGTLSHMTVGLSNPGQYEEYAARISAVEHVSAVAPRKEGLVLLAYQGEVRPCQVLGVDPQKEYEVGRLEDYLMTPYRRLKDQLYEVMELKGYKVEWELLAVDGDEAIIKQTQTYPPRSKKPGAEGPKIQSRISFKFDDKDRVVFMRRGLPVALPDSSETSGELYEKRREWVEAASESINDNEVESVIERFHPRMGADGRPLDPRRPFLLAGGRVAQTNPGILIGNELYRALRLRPGNEVELITARRNRETGEVEKHGEVFTIIGSFKSGMNEYDSRFIYAPYDSVVEFLDEKRGNLISISLDDFEHAQEVKTSLKNQGMPDVETWEDKRKNLLRAVDIERGVMNVIMFFFVLFTVVTIAVILILLVVEKVRDIGILKSMGATSTGIATIFMVNGLVAGAIGAVSGAIAGVTIALNVNEIADTIYDWTGWRIFPRDVYYLDRIPSDVDPMWVVSTVVVALSLCFICCLFPAWKAGRLQVVDTIKWE